MVNRVKGTGQRVKVSQEGKADKAKGKNSQVAAPDEFVKKSSKQGIKIPPRMSTGLKYLGSVDQLKGADQAEEGFEAMFKDVISDILGESGLDQKGVIDFALKSYKRFLKEHPEEKDHVKRQIANFKKKKEKSKKNSKQK